MMMGMKAAGKARRADLPHRRRGEIPLVDLEVVSGVAMGSVMSANIRTSGAETKKIPGSRAAGDCVI
jgi:hypothetical protein